MKFEITGVDIREFLKCIKMYPNGKFTAKDDHAYWETTEDNKLKVPPKPRPRPPAQPQPPVYPQQPPPQYPPQQYPPQQYPPQYPPQQPPARQGKNAVQGMQEYLFDAFDVTK